jgi:biotin transport system substrate-specific component
MATLMVLLTGLLLGTLYGSLCIAIYLILGTLGLPIFSNFGGGIGHIMGPTGGFLLSYLPACCIMGLASKYKYSNKRPKNFTRLLIIIYCTVATLLIYTIGTIWFANYTKKTIDQSLVLTVYPFLIGDAFKIAISIVLHEKLTRLKI